MVLGIFILCAENTPFVINPTITIIPIITKNFFIRYPHGCTSGEWDEEWDVVFL